MKLFYKYDYVSSLNNGKYYFYFFQIYDENHKEIDHFLNDKGTLTYKKVISSRDKAIKICEKLGIDCIKKEYHAGYVDE